MDYAEAREVFFAPGTPAEPPPASSPARQLHAAIAPLAAICWWSEPAYDVYAGLGLDFIQGYVWSRACVLGDAAPAVAVATFGVFAPHLVSSALRSARAKVSLEAIRDARRRGSVRALKRALGRPDGAAPVIAALRRCLEVGRPIGRPLFAGMAALPWPDDDFGALWHACLTLREYRFDSYIAACVHAGLSGEEASMLTELWVGWTGSAHSVSRGWRPEALDAAAERLHARGLIQVGGLSQAGRALRDALEDEIDASLAPLVAAIGDDMTMVLGRCDAWSQRIIRRGWFPPHPGWRALP